MGEITVKESSNKPAKKRMPWWGKLLITLGIIFILIPGILVGVIYACFYDGSHKEVDVRDNVETAQVFEGAIVDSLDNTTSAKKMSVALKDNDLNQVLYNVLNANAQIKEYVPNFYVEASEGKYNFYIEANFKNIFKTKVTLYTESVITDELITFKVNNIQVGRIGGFNNFSGLVNRFIDSATITNALKSSGLNLNFSLDKLEITYAMSDFQNDVKNLLKLPSEYSGLFNEIIGNKDIRTISATGNNLFALDINLTPLKVTAATHGINNFTVKDGYYSAFINDLRHDVVGLLNASKIQVKDANVVSKFLLGGEAVLTTSEQSTINTYKTAGAFDGVTHATTPYYDFTTDVASTLKSKVQSQITEAAVLEMITFGTPIDVNLTSSDLDLMFSTSEAFANINCFVADKSTDGTTKNYKDNYIMMDRASTIMNGEKIFFAINVNFNGEPTQISIEARRKASTAFATMKFDITRILLGDIEVGQSTKDAFLSLINSALGNDAFSSVFSITNQEITFNLSSILNEKGITSLNATVDFAIQNSTATEDGKLVISLNRKV